MSSPARKTTRTKAMAAPEKKTTVKAPEGKTPTQSPAQPALKELTKSGKADKAKKPKLVRDSFTFPKDEYVELESLKQRALKLTHSVKKGELLRAGLKALGAMPDAVFLQTLRLVPSLKTGRPKKG